MRRDMDLVRTILLVTEDADGIPDFTELESEHGQQVLAYHRWLVYQAGLVDALVVEGEGLDIDDGGAPFCRINGLTWEGQDFIAVARNSTLYAKVKVKAMEVIGGLTLDALKVGLKLAAKEAMGGDALDLG